jgi:hypothetical protein
METWSGPKGRTPYGTKAKRPEGRARRVSASQ